MNHNHNTSETDSWLGAIAVASAISGLFPITALCGGTLLARKTARPIADGVKAVGTGIGKGTYLTARATKKAITPKPKAPQRLPTPTKQEHAHKAGEKYEETCALIDSLPLDDDEKEAMKIHAKKQLVNQMWGLLK